MKEIYTSAAPKGSALEVLFDSFSTPYKWECIYFEVSATGPRYLLGFKPIDVKGF
ncbi:MAG: hypothetical protein QXE79_08355 [Candidatus Bathyarchaeia archaeon]